MPDKTLYYLIHKVWLQNPLDKVFVKMVDFKPRNPHHKLQRCLPFKALREIHSQCPKNCSVNLIAINVPTSRHISNRLRKKRTSDDGEGVISGVPSVTFVNTNK